VGGTTAKTHFISLENALHPNSRPPKKKDAGVIDPLRLNKTYRFFNEMRARGTEKITVRKVKKIVSDVQNMPYEEY
jgi:hypothetical protein